MYLQTGDVLYKLTDTLPSNATKLTGNLIHKGNNNYHRIEGDFELYELDSKMFIIAKDNCELIHEEHKTIIMPMGIYEKGIVLEYDHFLEESREVID